MKHLFTFLLLTFSAQTFAQSTIISLSVSPPNPTTTDNIQIIAELSFPSSNCDLDFKNHNVVGVSINASTHHCLGLLGAICNTADTFEVGQLPADTYTFQLVLTSGFGGPGCSPGIVADDSDQLTFTVSGSVGINELSVDPNFAFPNPASNKLFLKQALKDAAIITDVSGAIVLNIEANSTEIDVSELPAGIYFLKSESKRFKFVKK